MHLSPKAFAACALLSFSPLCLADFYVGGAGTLTEYSKYSDVDNGFGGQVFGGFRPTSFPMVFEVGYLSAGKSKVDDFTVATPGGTVSGQDVKLSFNGALASAGFYGKWDRKGSGGFAKLGLYTGKSKISGNFNGTNLDESQNSSGVMFALGADWMITRYFGLRADVGSLLNVKDVVLAGSNHKSNITTANLGVVFAFGGSETDYGPRGSRASAPAPVFSPAVPAPVYSAPADAPVYSPPVVPAPAPESAASAPVAVTEPAAQAPVVDSAPQPAPAGKASAGTAQLVPGAVLRSGPTMKSAAIKSMPNGGAVKLLKRETNEEGPWWSVQLEDGTTGWMIEWGLTRISRR